MSKARRRRPGKPSPIAITPALPSSYPRPESSSSQKPRAYLQEFDKVPEAACQYIDTLLQGLNADTRRFFKHVLSSGPLKRYEDRWVPVPWTLLHKKCRLADLDELYRRDLIEVTLEDRFWRQCREYRIPDHVQWEYDRLSLKNMRGPWVNLFTGRPTQRRQRSKLNDENNNPLPVLIRSVLETLRDGYFNDEAVMAHLVRLERTATRAEIMAAREDDPDGPLHKEARKLRGKLTTDLHCFVALWSQEPEPVGGGIYRYRLAYRPTSTGRISQIGGGAQSCSRAMKEAIYEGVVGVHNYDLKASQAYILADYLSRDGLNDSWIRRYLGDSDAKNTYARRVGLQVDTWKQCLYALLMGATLPKSLRSSRNSDIVKAIRADVGPDRAEEVFQRFRQEVAPLYEVLQRWHASLEARIRKAVVAVGFGSVQNEAGMPLDKQLFERTPPHELRARLAAFVLQGREAAFVHTLVILAPLYGYAVIAHEHDGVVTIGAVPEEAVAEARRKVGMDYAVLVEKAFL